jgi:DNA-binding IclR family transcriptional regulator
MDSERFGRSFDVIDLLINQPRGLRLSEIAKQLELPVSSLHDLLQKMAAAKIVAVSDGPRYLLGPRTIRMAIRAAETLNIRTIARRHMQDLAERIGEDIYLAVRVGNAVISADRVDSGQPVTVKLQLGHSWALHATSAGKLFVAYDEKLEALLLSQNLAALTEATIVRPDAMRTELAEIRNQGYAISREESVEGIIGYAAPVRDAQDQLIAVLHVSAPKGRATTEYEQTIIAAACATANAIEAEIGRSGPEERPPFVQGRRKNLSTV